MLKNRPVRVVASAVVAVVEMPTLKFPASVLFAGATRSSLLNRSAVAKLVPVLKPAKYSKSDPNEPVMPYPMFVLSDTEIVKEAEIKPVV